MGKRRAWTPPADASCPGCGGTAGTANGRFCGTCYGRLNDHHKRELWRVRFSALSTRNKRIRAAVRFLQDQGY